MVKNVKLFGFPVIRLYGYTVFLLLFIISSLFIGNSSFALDVPYFYGSEVVVTALKMPSPKATTPWSVSLIESKDLKFNLTETLRDIPGIDLKSSGFLGSVATARLQGSTSQQVLILKDGIRLNSPLLGMIDLNDILLNGFERIEVVRAPLSAVYGSEAIGGVVNIIPSKAKTDKAKIRLSLGTYNTQNAKLSFGGNVGEINSFTLANYIGSNGFRQNSDYKALGFNQKLNGYYNGNWEIGLDYYNADKGVPRVPNSQSNPYSASTPGDRQKDENLLLRLKMDNFMKRNGQSINIWSNNMFEKFHSYNFITSAFEDTEYSANSSGIDISQTYKTFLYGIEFRADKGKSAYIGRHETNNYAAFLQDTLTFGSQNYVLGIRIDKPTIANASINPRVGASYAFNDMIFRVSAGTAYKAPTLNDLYWNDPLWQMYGDSSLKPEKSQTIDIGIDKYFGDIASLSLSGYKTNITDLIMWDWDTTTFITRAKNIGAVDSSGVIAEYNHKFGRRSSVFANATIQESKDTKDINSANVGKYVPYSPKLKYTLGIRATEDIKITLRYVAERFADSGNTVKVPEYSLVDISAKHDFNGVTASLTIDNLFDQVYYESAGYHPTTYQVLMYPMPGRRITLSLGGVI